VDESEQIFIALSFTKALVFASRKHQLQRRKNDKNLPYINHPIEVAHILAEAGITDVKILSTAVLHDTLEDTETTSQELDLEFGQEVRLMVEECSDDKSLGKAERKKAQIEHSLHISNGAKLVKIADKISNNRAVLDSPPLGWNATRITAYFIWSQAVCRNLRGVSEALDNEVKAVFEESGINKFSQEEKDALLEAYYA
jgi:guanosine-3',5'-bis(diphosphate) 3'-pyrophosphohydrolase